MKTLAIDYGTKRIGIAISDPLGIIATGYPTLDAKVALEKIQKLVQAERISKIVLGYPLKMNGTKGLAVEAVESFRDKLKELVEVPITFWDERLSTAEATKRLIEADVSRAKRKLVVDKTAATIILQGYLDSKRSS